MKRLVSSPRDRSTARAAAAERCGEVGVLAADLGLSPANANANAAGGGAAIIEVASLEDRVDGFPEGVFLRGVELGALMTTSTPLPPLPPFRRRRLAFATGSGSGNSIPSFQTEES